MVPTKQSFKKTDGSTTSVSLEPAFLLALREMAAARGGTTNALMREIDQRRSHANLTSVLRLFVLDHFIARGALENDP
ncbi:ribbon-helix-helix domain-containing protein [Tardiphaga robiniae]|uniref:Ribbon-helix-helix domain-containing protein n=1 Tax=Tardiphaga robiniae TaxID=943830 RepID=A0A7G6U834_9BRAD|nr:ribbon-helix-helix domain-containing protein [Tardiphaga robiniae]QND75166.1 ribbon-helix-helix domain-containing protein [Tardiphaga robiniae]